MGATEAEVEVNPIGFEVLKQKHNNGKVVEIHKQIFFDLEKDTCPCCDMKSDEYFRLYVKEAKRMAIASQAMMEVAGINADKLSNRLAVPYNPKNIPSPVEVRCSCGRIEKVGYDSTQSRDRQVGEPVPVLINPDQYQCSSCWWNSVGQFK